MTLKEYQKLIEEGKVKPMTIQEAARAGLIRIQVSIEDVPGYKPTPAKLAAIKRLEQGRQKEMK